VDSPVAFTSSQVTTAGGVLSTCFCVIVAEEFGCADRCDFDELLILLPLIIVLGSEAVSEVAVGLVDGVDGTLDGFSLLQLLLRTQGTELEEASADVVDARRLRSAACDSDVLRLTMMVALSGLIPKSTADILRK
jgi:hypothetical protein